MADDLKTPLGLMPPRNPRRRLIGAAIAGGAVAALLAAGFIAAGLLRQPGPTATAVIDAPTDRPPIAPDRTGSLPPPTGLIEVAPDGALTEIGGEVVIHDPSDPAPLRLAAGPDIALLEETSYGPLPRVGDDGARPLDAYARPAADDDREIRVAIVVGGIGVDSDGTRRAIATLPGAVTLAFAPYGDDLARDLARARAAGHEILLQVPLEPFSYPATDPGPHTLTTDAAVEENLARLRWVMGRITTYVGVVNYMGARFTGDPEALAPVLEEIGGRGLLYLDDGSSSRSRAGEVAANRAPFLRADLVLDADLTAAAIDERLRQLAALARERGFAIATATAFPVTIERVAAFARAAADRGIAIVPLTALAP
jgi:hypothetical protein